MKKQVEAVIPTRWGDFRMLAYADKVGEQSPHVVLIHPDCDTRASVTVRVHSECLTGDLLGSLRCDCGEQLAKSMDLIAERKGVLIYLRQEGRGIGLINKLKAYNLQDQGLNTLDANLHLGFQADERDYQLAIDILNDLNVRAIDLITNNPEKIKAIDDSDIQLHERIPIVIDPKEKNRAYLKTKKDLMGHLLGEAP